MAFSLSARNGGRRTCRARDAEQRGPELGRRRHDSTGKADAGCDRQARRRRRSTARARRRGGLGPEEWDERNLAVAVLATVITLVTLTLGRRRESQPPPAAVEELPAPVPAETRKERQWTSV